LHLSALCVGACLTGGHALAWGATGHRLIARAAAAALPTELPLFLRDAGAVASAGELAREPDRWRAAGRTHDADRDPAHFLDLDDAGAVLGGPPLAALPETRAAYDAALRAVGSDSWKAGYLPYSIVDGWQQLAKDLAYWRADMAGAAKTADLAHRAWLLADLAERQALTLRDTGVLAHYVGDGSQPLHVTIHFNGWRNAANPKGYTNAPIHSSFEGELARRSVDEAAVSAAMAPASETGLDLARWTATYLAATGRQVAPLYELERAGALVPGDPRGRAFVSARLGAGAAALRDLIVAAWRASAAERVGWPEVAVADVESGRVDPFDSLYGAD
jgi:hypothetical protein